MIMDIEENYKSNEEFSGYQNRNDLMLELLVQLLDNKKNSNRMNQFQQSSINNQQEQMSNLYQQFKLVQENHSKQAYIQQIIQQQSHMLQQQLEQEQQKKEQNSLFEMIFLRHQLREQELRQIQSEQYASFNYPTLDLMEDEKKQQSLNGIKNFDHLNQNSSTCQFRNHQINNNSHTNSNDLTIEEEEEDSNTFDQIKNYSSSLDNSYPHQQKSSNFMNQINNQNSKIDSLINEINLVSNKIQSNGSDLNNCKLDYGNYFNTNQNNMNFTQQTYKNSSLDDLINQVQKQIISSNDQSIQQLQLNSNQNGMIRNSDQNIEYIQNQNENIIYNEYQNTNEDFANYHTHQVNFTNVVQKIPQNVKHNDKILICGGLIFFDGIIRNSGLNHVSFGYQQDLVVQVEEKKNFNVVSLLMGPDQNLKIASTSEAIGYIERSFQPGAQLQNIKDKIPSHTSQLFKEQIKPNNLNLLKQKIQIHMKQRQQLKNVMANFTIDENIFKWKGDDFYQFVDQAYKFLAGYDQSQTRMYQYTIGVINQAAEDVQIHEVGYSKSYLNLLGIDVQNFNSMMMRGYKIDLINDKETIQQQTLYMMLQCFNNVFEVEIYTDINTFDGFPLTIHQKQKKMNIPFYQKKSNSREYCLFVTEVDVNLNDLTKLINYRQNISNNQLTYDDFIRKELSYLFEDVEYSVHSQSFLEKYYKENLQQLQTIRKSQQPQKTTKVVQENNQLENTLKPVQYNIVAI